MTAAAPFPSDGRRPLGEVLVERGVVTPEQLSVALEHQRSTGQPLGEIIVAFGFAPGPIVNQALATQKGGMIKTEYGFATGWSTDAGPPPVPAPAQVDSSAELAKRDTTIAELRAWSEKAQTAIDSRDDAIARLRAELTEQRAMSTRVESLETDLEAAAKETHAVRAELEAELAARDAALVVLRAELEAERARPTTPPAVVEKHAAEISHLEASVATLTEAAATNEHEVAAARRTIGDLERRLENAGSRAETLARRITEQDQELEALRTPAADEPSRWSSAATHYVLRRNPDGYDLVAHDGPPPAVGDIVDGLRVARVARVGPALDVACAYLAD